MSNTNYLKGLHRRTIQLLRYCGKTRQEAYLDTQKTRGLWAFIHINKCGGTSVEQVLNIPKIHDTALQRRDLLGANRWEKLTSFSIVRHPHARVKSLYRYRIKTNQTGMGDGHIGLNDWIRAVFAEQDPAYYDKPQMFLSSRAWLVDDNDRIIVDFIGKLETIADDWCHIQELIGIRADLPQANTTSIGWSGSEDLDQASRDTLATYFDADFTTFDYYR
jgi:chondroitin 4-sulfotransferase 11